MKMLMMTKTSKDNQPSFIHWNAQCIRNQNSKIACITNLLDKFNPMAFAITETWTRVIDENIIINKINNNQYHYIFFHCDNEYSGILIILRKDITYNLLHDHSIAFTSNMNNLSANNINKSVSANKNISSMLITLDLILPNTEHILTLSVLYRAPSCTVTDWKKIINKIPKHKKHKHNLIIGDFNLNIRNTHTRNDLYTDLLVPLDLNLLNEVASTTKEIQSTHNNNSTLDLALSTHLQYIKSFEVITDISDSDHEPIHVQLSIPLNNNSNIIQSNATLNHTKCEINILKCNEKSWDSYKMRLDVEATKWLDNTFPEILNGSKTNEQNINIPLDPMEIATKLTHSITAFIHETASITLPTRKNKMYCNNKRTLYFTNDIKEKFVLFKDLQKKYYKTKKNRERFKEDYRKARREFRTAINRATNIDMSKKFRMLTDVNTTTAIFTYIRAIRELNNSNLSSIVDKDSKLPMNIKQSMNNLAKHFAETSSTSDITHAETELLVKNTIDNIELNGCNSEEPINFDDFLKITQKIKPSSSPGPDGIYAQLIINAPTKLCRALYLLHTYCWKHGLFPTQLKDANILALYKKKGSMNLATNYRPIALTSIIARIFERAILTHLQPYISRLNYSQVGFRKDCNTIDALYKLLHYIKKELYLENGDIPIIFLDIEKAFDKIWIDGLLYKLHKMGIRGNLWLCIRSFLINRRIRVKQGDLKSDWYNTTAGVPQGTVLGPILYLLYTSDLSDVLSDNIAKLNSYADDNTIIPNTLKLKARAKLLFDRTKDKPDDMTYRKQLTVVYNTMLQNTLNSIEDWARKWKVKFSTTKSFFMVFSTTKNNRMKLNLTLNKRPLNEVDICKYLGLNLTYNLKFNLHEDITIKKANSLSYLLCKTLRNINCKFKYYRQLIHSLFYSSAGYAIELWSPSTHFFNTINNIMARTIKSILHLSSNTCTEDTLIETRTPPFHIYKSATTINSYFRFIKNLKLTTATSLEIRRELKHYKIYVKRNTISKEKVKHWKSYTAYTPNKHLAPFLILTISAMFDLDIYERIKKTTKTCILYFLNQWISNDIRPTANANYNESKLHKLYNKQITSYSHLPPLYLHNENRTQRNIRCAFRLNRFYLREKTTNKNNNIIHICDYCDDDEEETREHLLIYCNRFTIARQPSIELATNINFPFSETFVLASEQIQPLNERTETIISIYNNTAPLLTEIYKFLKKRLKTLKNQQQLGLLTQ